jgi:hypothetical protein
MRRLDRGCFVLFAVGVVLAACSSSEPVSSAPVDAGTKAPATAEEACEHHFRAGVERCSSAEISPQEIAGIRTRYVANCVAELGLSGATRTPADLDACASALEAKGCVSYPEFVAECVLKPGTLPEGTACNISAQCQTGVCAYLDTTGTSGCGVCTAVLKEGERCTQDKSFCERGTSCTGSLEKPRETTCKRVTYAEPQAPCSYNVLCGPGYVCAQKGDNPTPLCYESSGPGGMCEEDVSCNEDSFCDKSTRKCVSRAKAGEACSSVLPCAKGLGCDKTQSTCAPIIFAAPGERCGGNIACAQGVCGQGTGAPTCPPVVEDGRGCLANGHMTCKAPAFCLGGKCVMTATQACK